MSKKTKKQHKRRARKDQGIVPWLKRVFKNPVSILSMIIALFGAYFAYLNYENNKPGQLLVLFGDVQNGGRLYDKGGRVMIFSYLVPPTQTINDGDTNIVLQLKYPTIVNANKEIKGLNLAVTVNEFENIVNSTGYNYHIDPDFEIISETKDSLGSTSKELKYKYNYLDALQEIQIPVDTFFLGSKESIKNELKFPYEFNYRVGYSGMSSFYFFLVTIDYIYEENTWDITDKQIDQYLELCYDFNYFGDNCNKIVMIICGKTKSMLIKPKRIKKYKDLVKFKRKIIKEYNKL